MSDVKAADLPMGSVVRAGDSEFVKCAWSWVPWLLNDGVTRFSNRTVDSLLTKSGAVVVREGQS
jgi:hypothetical protein